MQNHELYKELLIIKQKKSMRYKSLLLLFCLGIILQINGQEYYDTICWVWVNNPQYYAVKGDRFSDKSELNALLLQNHVSYYEQAYPFAKTLELLKIHEIRCATGTSIDNVISALTNRFGDVYYNFSMIEIIDDYPMDYDPVDYFWTAHANDWLWHLKKIKADLAWGITQGDTTIKTAVLDGSIDYNHPDLASEIYPHFDLYDSVAYNPTYFHGTAVASFVSGETTKLGEISNGHLASVGFDTKMISYYSLCDINTFLQKALHSSTVMGADVLVSCAGASLYCYPHPLTGEDLVMKEILNNGTVIVMPAGNGYNSRNRTYCGDEYQATEHYPFNSSYDERVIVVTSTDSLDYHGHIIEGIDHTHSHFPTIDICAPGYDVFGAMPVNSNPTFPYYGYLNGTSFAAPIVAGACALLKSINKDFTPGEIQYFIKSTADPVQDENLFHGMLGSGRLNVYGAVAMANNCSPGCISTTEYWSRDTTIVCGLEIMNGGSLTISSNIKLSKHSPIIVHPGGKLIIDGGYLTSLDNIQWQDIQVWGDRTEDQNIHHGIYKQGYLEMKNGATIENAVCAVELWHPNYYNSTGGIIHATDAVFRNNAKSIHALYYINYNPNTGHELSYNNLFENCEFIIDENYLGTETFFKHVDLDRVKDFYFRGCDFTTDMDVDGVSSYCAGIAAYSASFRVSSICNNEIMVPCPENDIRRCTFTGFNNGVLAVNTDNDACTLTVEDAVFTNNNRGIFAQNTGFASIVGNEFTIGCNSDCGYGIYADGVYDFCIEENTFEHGTNTHCSTYGIGIFNSREANDIYRNSFDGLTCGNIAYGVNYAIETRIPEITRGLTYTCNLNASNMIDFCVLVDGNSGAILPKQGSATSPANNTFSGNRYHFYNGGEFSVDYFYNPNALGTVPNINKIFNVRLATTTSINNCLSHYGNSRVLKTPEEKAALADAYQSAADAFNMLKDLYESQVASGITPKPELVEQMSQYAHDRDMAAGDIIRSDLNDSVANTAELRQWLANMHNIAADRMIVASYMHEGDFTNAFTLANTFPDVYTLQGDDMSDHVGYMTILNLFQTLYKSGRTVHEMSENEKEVIADIADNGYGSSKLMARGIIMETSDRYVEPYICPNMPRVNGRETNAFSDNIVEDDNGFTITVSPIPATTWVNVDYNLPEPTSRATMTIINTIGVKVVETELAGTQGTQLLELRDIPSGVYSYIVCCGEYMKTGKLVITK